MGIGVYAAIEFPVKADKKLLTIEDNEPLLKSYRCFLALANRLYAEKGDFFLQPHSTSVVWGGIPEEWGNTLSRPDPESVASSTACTDGIDSSDPGCSDTPPPLPALPPHWTVDKADSPKPPQGYRLIKATR